MDTTPLPSSLRNSTREVSLDALKADTKVLAFDIFGTVVDWHGSIMREIHALAPSIDANAFALAWRAGYQPAMARVRSGELGWTRIDELHRMILEDLLPQFGLTYLSQTQRAHLNRVWHRLEAWPDSVQGLLRLKKKFIICSLSNGNMGLLTNMAKNASLPWDCILSAEVFRAYKPDPATYLGVVQTFDLQPHEVMLCAAHHDDLVGARSCGLHTAYIERPLEFGASQPKDVSPQQGNNLHVRDIHALADLLGC